MIDQLQALRDRALEDLARADEKDEIEQWRIQYLGKRGELTQVLRGLGTITPSERPVVGRIANEIKETLESELNARVERLAAQQRAQELAREAVDVTLPGRTVALGQRHIVNVVIEEIADAFQSMGFQIAEGPEVEWDYYNFEALNIPQDHPARDMWDTFYVAAEVPAHSRFGAMLLRTHTSPDQIRVMEQMRPPVRVIVPGKVYRYEAVDATHESVFHQIEGLAVDENLTMADLKGTLSAFARRIFGRERRTRFRCDFFPFVEPGAEMAIDCFVCQGVGCRLCKGTGWIEIMGAGMVHPNVLAGVNYDPNKYTGFAFGMGVERVAMLKYGIDDIRLFLANDLRFLRQFR